VPVFNELSTSLEELCVSGCIDQRFLDFGTVEGEWSISRPGRFIPGQRALRSRCIRGWVGLRTGLNDIEK
jgi:hypothetical protein